MAYEKINFVNGTAPPINATFLNTLQDELITNGVGKETYTQNFSLGYFSENVVKGALTEMTIEGLTVDNQVVNGNMVNTTGWLGANGTLSASNNIMSVTGTGTNALVSMVSDSTINDVDFKQNDVWFVYSRMRVTNSDATNIRHRTAGGFLDVNIASAVQNKWYEFYTKGTIGADATVDIFQRSTT